MKKWKKELLGSKWQNVNDNVIQWNVLTYTNIAEIKRNSRIYI